MVALDDGTPDTTAATLRTDTIGRSEDEIFITVTTDQGVQSTHFFDREVEYSFTIDGVHIRHLGQGTKIKIGADLEGEILHANR